MSQYTLPSGCHLGANCAFLHENDPLTSKPKAPTLEDIERHQKARKKGQNAGGQKQLPPGPSSTIPGKSTTVPTVKTIKAPVQREVSPKIHMIRLVRFPGPPEDRASPAWHLTSVQETYEGAPDHPVIRPSR